MKKTSQDSRDTIYICDPAKATKCSKEGCWYSEEKGPCKCTKKRKQAKLDDAGKPIEATDIDIWNEEYRENLLKEALGL